MQRINKKEVIRYIKNHPLLLKDFDLNNDGFLDDYEVNNIYAAVVEYLSKRLTHKWYYSHISENTVHGPVNFASVPKAKNPYIRPDGSELWLPYAIMGAARKFEFKNTEVIGQVLLSTTDYIHGYNIIEHKGMVWGVTVRAKDFFSDFIASIQNFIGGELGGYTQLAIDAKQQAIDRMITSARRSKANAIIRVGFDSENGGCVTAYGTAVVVEEKI